MPSTDRLIFFTIVSSLVFAIFCLLMAGTALASRNYQRAEDHSPAYDAGKKALLRDRYEKAAEHFQQAASDKPDDMWAFYYLGLCLLKLNRFDDAAKAYQQAMSLNPGKAEVHYQLGKIHLERGDLEAARKEYHWLQGQDQELALYLSDLFPVENPVSPQQQETGAPGAKDQPADESIPRVAANLRPTILYREKAKYTEIARINHTQGAVALQVVFHASGELRDIRATRKLPDGLTRKAIEAARKIRFKPVIRDGAPISVRGNLEFTFNLY